MKLRIPRVKIPRPTWLSRLVDRVRVTLCRSPRWFVHELHPYAHMAYLAAASVEMHGAYSLCAFGLLVLVLVATFMGEDLG